MPVIVTDFGYPSVTHRFGAASGLRRTTADSEFYVLEKACKDYPRKLDVEINGTFLLNFIIPKFLLSTERNSSKVSGHAVACMSSFVPIGSQTLFTHALMLRLALCPDKLMPELGNVAEYMFHSTQDKNEFVALEACEFGLPFAEDPNLSPFLHPVLPRVAPVLLDSEDEAAAARITSKNSRLELYATQSCHYLAFVYMKDKYAYPQQLNAAWEKLQLIQLHDVFPRSATAAVTVWRRTQASRMSMVASTTLLTRQRPRTVVLADMSGLQEDLEQPGYVTGSVINVIPEEDLAIRTSFMSDSVLGRRQHEPDALELGPRKRPRLSHPLVHHGRHFGRTVHAMCNVEKLLIDGLAMLSKAPEELTAKERRQKKVYAELMKIVPTLEDQLTSESSTEEDVRIAAQRVCDP
ncbi:hypothetical protein OF83DRAFT_1178605 [Amylostereum chailletii]|nr:hypothetical protein OF83DRAFT_1178605 [Amylostereum chailletii]